jgi:hypothetical protein
VVGAAEGLLNPGGCRAHGCIADDIGDNGRRADGVLLLHFTGDCGELLIAIDEGDITFFGGESQGDGSADPAGPADDDGRLSG